MTIKTETPAAATATIEACRRSKDKLRGLKKIFLEARLKPRREDEDHQQGQGATVGDPSEAMEETGRGPAARWDSG